MIRLIAALDDARGIAAKGRIPWDIPSDRKFFREQTAGHPIVMGYRTYEEFKTPLAGRQNLVLDTRGRGVRPGFVAVHDLRQFLTGLHEDVWVIGGAGLFNAAIAYADELVLTHVKGEYGCDRFFPPYEDTFTLAKRTEPQLENGFEFYMAWYRNIKAAP